MLNSAPQSDAAQSHSVPSGKSEDCLASSVRAAASRQMATAMITTAVPSRMRDRRFMGHRPSRGAALRRNPRPILNNLSVHPARAGIHTVRSRLNPRFRVGEGLVATFAGHAVETSEEPGSAKTFEEPSTACPWQSRAGPPLTLCPATRKVRKQGIPHMYQVLNRFLTRVFDREEAPEGSSWAGGPLIP